MTKQLEAHTNDELRARINKGQRLLDPAHKILFAAWTKEHERLAKRRVERFTKASLIAAFTTIAELYRAQQRLAADEKFEDKTLSLRERTQLHAAQMRTAMKAAKEQAIATGKAVRVKIADIRA